MKFRARTAWAFTATTAVFIGLGYADQAQAQVKLEYRFPEGRALKYKATVKTKQTLTIQGMEVETSSEQASVTRQTTGKKRDDSNIPVEEKIESVRIELSLPGGINLTIESNEPDAKIDNPQLAFLGEAIKANSGAAYTVVLDGQNKVKAVEGTEKILEKAEKLSEQARNLITAQMKTEKLKRRFEQEHGNLPEVLARPGDTWERNEVIDISGGQILAFKKKFEYAGTEALNNKTLDKIKTTVTGVEIKSEGDGDAPFKLLKSELKVLESDGTVLFDREGGHVVSQKSKLHVKGDKVTYSFNGNELPGAIEFSMDVDNELQPSAK